MNKVFNQQFIQLQFGVLRPHGGSQNEVEEEEYEDEGKGLCDMKADAQVFRETQMKYPNNQFNSRGGQAALDASSLREGSSTQIGWRCP